MRIANTEIPGVHIVDPMIHRDVRGAFAEVWHQGLFAAQGLADTWVQENHCLSHRHVLRGLHYQDLRAPQVRLVRCTRGLIWDVVVDLRETSPTFGKHLAMELSADNVRQVRVPVGCAHGFLVLSEEAEVRYLCSSHWCPEAEGVVRWDDPDLAIPWPIARPVLSDRDRSAPGFAAYRSRPAFRFGACPEPA